MKKKINWKKREEILYKSIDKVKKNKKSDFDCIVPVSGVFFLCVFLLKSGLSNKLKKFDI